MNCIPTAASGQVKLLSLPRIKFCFTGSKLIVILIMPKTSFFDLLAALVTHFHFLTSLLLICKRECCLLYVCSVGEQPLICSLSG